MGCKPTWKSFTLHGWERQALQSYWGSSKGAFAQYTWILDDGGGGGGYLETNIPYRYLRQLFSYAGVPLRDHVTDIMPSWERYPD